MFTAISPVAQSFIITVDQSSCLQSMLWSHDHLLTSRQPSVANLTHTLQSTSGSLLVLKMGLYLAGAATCNGEGTAAGKRRGRPAYRGARDDYRLAEVITLLSGNPGMGILAACIQDQLHVAQTHDCGKLEQKRVLWFSLASEVGIAQEFLSQCQSAKFRDSGVHALACAQLPAGWSARLHL